MFFKKFLSFLFVASILSMPIQAFAKSKKNSDEIEYKTLLNYYFAQKPELLNKDSIIEDYAASTECSKYIKNKRNMTEYDLNNYKEDIKTKLTETIGQDSSKKLPDTIVISENFKFGKYDKEKEILSFKPFSEKDSIVIAKKARRSIQNCDSKDEDFPKQFKIKLINADAIDGLQIDPVSISKMNKRFGNVAKLKMGLKIESIDLNKKAAGKSLPQINAKIVKMQALHLDRQFNPRMELVKYDEEKMAEITNKWSKIKDTLPMKFNSENLNTWVNSYNNPELANKLNPIKFKMKYASISYPKETYTFKPKTINPNGTAKMNAEWGRRLDNPKYLPAQKTDIGEVIIELSNAKEFGKEHIANKKFVDFMSTLKYPAGSNYMYIKPKSFEEKIINGRKYKVFISELDSIEYNVTNTTEKTNGTVVFNKSTKVN